MFVVDSSRPPKAVGDPFLSTERMNPEFPKYSSITAVISEEFGPDAPVIVGDHAETLAMVSDAILKTPAGERGLRLFLRHLRAVAGTTPTYIASMRNYASDIAMAEAQARMTAGSLNTRVEGMRSALDNERAFWSTKLDEAHRAFADEIAQGHSRWAAERNQLQRQMHCMAADAAAERQAMAEELVRLQCDWGRQHQELKATRAALEQERVHSERQAAALGRAEELLLELSHSSEGMRFRKELEVAHRWLGHASAMRSHHQAFANAELNLVIAP